MKAGVNTAVADDCNSQQRIAELASREQIVAVPTLIKQLPLPLRRLIGDMSDEERVLVGLDILPHH